MVPEEEESRMRGGGLSHMYDVEGREKCGKGLETFELVKRV